MSTQPLVIVGAGLAGAKAAEGARSAEFDGAVIMVGEEGRPPYERPPLSKGVLRGEAEATSAHVHPEGFYVEHDIELVDDPAVSLDLTDRTVTLDSGRAIEFGRLVLATGAEPRRLGLPGADLPGIHTLRTIQDAISLQDAIRRSGRVAVVGAGWIGSEVAASARQMGADVVVVDPGPVPLHRVLGDQVGAVFADLHREHGVELRLGTGVQEFRGGDHVDGVVLSDGTVVEVDVVVVGVGVVPRVALAEKAGLRVDDGVVVDEYLETSIDGVFAAGDVANAWHPHYGRSLRVEHWANALNQGTAAGENAAGRRRPYDRLPYFFSDQYDLGMEYVGHAEPGDAVVIRGDLDARTFVAFWHREGMVTAAMNVNVWDVADELKALVLSETPADPAQLGDPDLALSELT